MTPHLATAETPLLPSLWGKSKFTLQQLLETMQQILSNPESGCLDLKSHHLALAVAKKTLDDNGFKHAKKKTTNCSPPNFKVGDIVYFKNKQPGKWDLKWRAGYRIVCIECNGHYLPYRKPNYQKKLDPAMSRMLCMSHQVSYGMLTKNLAEMENL